MKSSNSLSRILPFAVTGLLLVVCLLLPLLFTGGEGQAPPSNPGEGMTASERARLYSRYSDGELSLQDLDASEVGSTELVNCTRIYNTIVDTLVMDEGDVRVEDAQGYNFYKLSDGVHELRFVEFYHQWTGDWSNWIRLRIDLDTLDVYQLYYSASVLRNAQLYENQAEGHVSSALQSILLALGFTGEPSIVEYTSAEIEAEGAEHGQRLEVESSTGEMYCYDIENINIYEDAAPSILIDLELVLSQITAA